MIVSAHKEPSVIRTCLNYNASGYIKSNITPQCASEDSILDIITVTKLVFTGNVQGKAIYTFAANVVVTQFLDLQRLMQLMKHRYLNAN